MTLFERVFGGNDAVYGLTEAAIDAAIAANGEEKAVSFPDTAYALPCYYAVTGVCFYIDIYCIMGCYYTLCHNTYAYSLLFYKVYIRRENAGSWNSGLENEQILETYSAQLQKS